MTVRRLADGVYGFALLALLLGCGPAEPPTSRLADAAGPQVACNGGDAAFPVGLLSGPATDLATGDEADRALLAELEDEQTFGAGEGKLPADGWFRVVSREDFASWVRSEDRRTVVAAVDFERSEGAWTYLRSAPAGCPLRLVEPGVEFARVGAATTSGQQVELVAEAGSCGGPGPDVERVEVDETATTVTVVVRLEPEPRDRSEPCAGVGVGIPTTVELQQPLGTRTLLDGSEVPAVPVRTDAAR